MAIRKIVRIDEDKCDGCGLCVPSCAEGAIQVIDGKARLIKDQYCDGLGACLGECPQDAISIEEREAEEFDEAAVQAFLADQGRQPATGHAHLHGQPTPAPARPAAAPHRHPAGGCPGAAAMSFGGCPGSAARSMGAPEARPAGGGPATPSALRNWPLQLKLVPVMAPYLHGASLCVAADCTAFAFGAFHPQLLAGKVLLIGCPKLDDVGYYIQKMADIVRHNDIASIDVVYMEVPCCFGMVHIVRQALEEAGCAVPVNLIKIGIEGQIAERASLAARN